MADEETQNSSNLDEEAALLKAYKELEKNTVPKEQYEKDIAELKEKNELYLKAITEGSKVDEPTEKEYDIPEHIAKLNKFKGTNLEYWKQTTELTDKILTSIPKADIVKVTGDKGLESLIKVNEGMKQMVKDSNGNPDMFRSLYRARVIDSAPNISANIESAGGLVSYLQQQNNKK